jgi:hypothetical protein
VQRGLLVRVKHRGHEQRCGAGDFDEVQGIDDGVGAAGGDAVDSLRVFQVRIHACGGSNEPCAQVVGCVLAEAAVARKAPGCGECGYLDGEPDHGLAVVVEVVRIALAVAVDGFAVGVGGVGPEVIGLGEVVMQAAGAAGVR